MDDGASEDDVRDDCDGGLPPMVSVAVERRDALAVTLARVERGEIVLLEERGEEIAAVVPRELAVLLLEIAEDLDETGDRSIRATRSIGAEATTSVDGGPGDRRAPPVEVSFTDLGVDADAWAG